ncbi:MAG TPA: hypothetical protein VFA81_08055 [Burkholderiales bacterium]|nr:hypothetical protein [Burkholderiales bacterium]
MVEVRVSVRGDDYDSAGAVGMRLREAGVADETRDSVLWHNRMGTTAHYAVAQVREVLEALERITDERHAFNKTLTSIARESHQSRTKKKAVT